MTEQRFETGHLVARILLGGMFLWTAISKFGEMEALSSFLDGRGFPAPTVFAMIVTLVEAVGGVMLLLGIRARLVAMCLAVYLVLATALIHLDFGNSQQVVHIVKNIGLIGGLVAVFSAAPKRYQIAP